MVCTRDQIENQHLGSGVLKKKQNPDQGIRWPDISSAELWSSQFWTQLKQLWKRTTHVFSLTGLAATQIIAAKETSNAHRKEFN